MKVIIVGGVAGGASAATDYEDLMKKLKSLLLKEVVMFPMLIVVCLII